MASKRHRRLRGKIRYPKHAFDDPRDLMHFVEMDGFAEEWEKLKLSDDDLMELQYAIMLSWRQIPIVEQTGGLRKIRFRSESSNRGKSAGFRVGFVCFEEYGIVLLIVVYSKSEGDNLSAAGKEAIRRMIRDAKHWLDKTKKEGLSIFKRKD